MTSDLSAEGVRAVGPAPGGTRPRWRNASFVWGASVLSVLVVVAMVAPLALAGPANTLTADTNLAHSAGHWFGTDAFGRDATARALVATRLTLTMSLATTALSFVLGVLGGVLLQLTPHRPREVLLRLLDSAVAFPSLVLALVVAAVLGPGATSAVLAIGLAGIPGFVRLSSHLAAAVVRKDFVSTAFLLGVPPWRVLTRHVLPNISGPLLVLLTSSFTLSLLEISSLSFVGLGVQSPQYDWGRLLNEALPSIFEQPELVLAPSFMLVIAGVGAMLLGDGVARITDPRLTTQRVAATVATPVATESGPFPDDALLEVDGLTVRVGSTVLVDDVSFVIGPGQVVGLVGESGSGKSTIAMAVAGLLPDGLVASARRLRLADLDLLGRPSPSRMATEVGIVYQDPSGTFNPSLRLGRQLTEVVRVHLGRGRREAEEAMVSALDEVKVTEPRRRLTQHPHQLSGGMLQRASIAASMSTDPRLLIADEPTTALDVTVQHEVLRQFCRISMERSTSMLFISHDIGVVGALCDVVLVLHRGRVVDRTTGSALRTGGASHPYTRALLAATPGTAQTADATTPVDPRQHETQDDTVEEIRS